MASNANNMGVSVYPVYPYMVNILHTRVTCCSSYKTTPCSVVHTSKVTAAKHRLIQKQKL